MKFQFASFFPMELFMSFQGFFNEFDVINVFANLFIKLVISFLASFKAILLLFSSHPDISIQIRDHLLDIHSDGINILVLNFDFL